MVSEHKNLSDEGEHESLELIEMRDIVRKPKETVTKTRDVIATIHHQSPCSMILEGSFVDIHDMDALEPSDFGVDDIPYIDDD